MVPNEQRPRYHEDTTLFREALTYTESHTGFSARLIEKDYYCSVMLHDLAPIFQRDVIFKGGTCLSKVYTHFYRLSEDLGLTISTPVDVTRSHRRTTFAPIKEHLASMPRRFPCFEIVEPVKGFNLARQYIGRFAYSSEVTGQNEYIKIEIGLREPVIEPTEERSAKTLLTDPFRYGPVVGPVPVKVLSTREAYAEKIRAALTRRDPAVRDFYDVEFAVRQKILNPVDSGLLDILKRKLDVAGNDPITMRDEKKLALSRQLEPQLKPVLRLKDYESFELKKALRTVEQMAEAIHKG